jgi:AbrB family looped-hinge helix DNA binding protein
MIEVSKISAKGQVTIPIELRKLLQLTEGSKVAFITDSNGRVYLANSSMIALKEVQTEFNGVAKDLGIADESQVAAFLKEQSEE